MIRQTIEIEGRRFVLIPEVQLLRLERRAGRGSKADDLPALPKGDKQGNRPALEFIRASLARDIIRERKALGLTQERLVRLAGIRQETLSRLESAKHSPTVRTVDKIDRALKRAAATQRRDGQAKK